MDGEAVFAEDARGFEIGEPAAVFDAGVAKLFERVFGITDAVDFGFEMEFSDRVDEKFL
jgi:hypothetical protein